VSANEPLDLDAIEARANAATPGPWKRTGVDVMCYLPVHTVMYGRRDGEWQSRVENQVFIAHARADIPALIAAVRERDAEIARLKQWITAWGHRELCETRLLPTDNVACTCGYDLVLDYVLTSGDALRQTGTEPPQPAEGA